MKKIDILYYVAMFGVFFINLSDISKIFALSGTIRSVIYILLAILLLVKIIFTKYSVNQIFGIILLGAVSIYTSYILDNYMFIINFLGVIAVKDIKINTIIKLDIIVKLIFLVSHTIIYFYDYIFNYEKVLATFMYTNMYGIRQSFYFSHANTANGIVVWLAIEIIYLNRDKKIYYILGTLLMMFYSYFTVSRTSMIIFLLFLLLNFINYRSRNKDSFARKTNFCIKYIVDIFAIISFILIIMPQYINNTEIIDIIDNILSKRLYYSQWAIESYGFNLLPNIDTVILETSMIIDNFYIRCFVSYGIITVIILSLMYKLLPKNIDNMDRIILIIFPIYLFSELFSYNIGRAIPMLIIGYLIFNNKKKVSSNGIS